MKQLYTNSFIDALRRHSGDKEIFVDNRRAYTIEELLNSARSLAHLLSQKGVKSRDRVVLAIEPNFEFLKVMYANMMLNTQIAIIDPEMGHELYQAKLKQYKPQHIFVDSRLLFLKEHPILKWIVRKVKKTLPTLSKVDNCQLFTVGKRLPIFTKHYHLKSGENDTVYSGYQPVDESEDFLVVYTSGTLSEPKGVVHSYGSLRESIALLTRLLTINSHTKIATHLPHFMLLGMTAGIQVFKWNPEMKPSEKSNFINKHKITTLFGPPAEFMPWITYLEYNNEKLPSSIKEIILGSAPVYASFLSRLYALSDEVKITCLYGMTEHLMTCYIDGRDKINFGGQGDPLGQPFNAVELAIEDDEILVKSRQLFTKYLDNPNLQGFHKTGDLGRLDEDIGLILSGRKKDMIIRQNFNIYPALYEPTICKIEGVEEATLVGKYSEEKQDEEVYLIFNGKGSVKDIEKELHAGPYSIDKEALPDHILNMSIPRKGRQQKADKALLKKLISQ